ncbi:MAG: Wzt carbohydrate-binding domain-containing protein [Singulisphaera sp.]
MGDLAFQRKCMGRMREVGRGGTTVLFVSHNMPAIETLCTRALLLEEGRAIRDGDVQDLIGAYRRMIMAPRAGDGRSPFDRDGPDRATRVFRGADLLDAAGEVTNFLPLGGQFKVRIALEAPAEIAFPVIGIGIDDTLGQRILTLHTPLTEQAIARVAGRCAIDCRVDAFPLAPGDYWMKLALSAQGGEVDSVERALHFTVTNGEAFGEGRGFHVGLCVAPSRWELVAASTPSAAGDSP